MDKLRLLPYVRCAPNGICLYCCKNTDQIKTIGVGYCKNCQDTGIIDNPAKYYPKCDRCRRHHAVD